MGSDTSVFFLSLIVFLPTLGAAALIFFPSDREDAIKLFSLAITVAVFALTVLLLIPSGGDGGGLRFLPHVAAMQTSFSRPWIPSFDINYAMGLDGISFPLVLLTSSLSVLAMWASWSIPKQIKAYCMLFLVLETAMLGVFTTLDLFLFYVFWEVMLLPMYFLIGVWGGPRREYAAIKFFLYTLLGGVLMLIALLMLYFNSDLTQLDRNQMVASMVPEKTIVSVEAEGQKPPELRTELHTFNMLALAEMGRRTSVFDREILFGKSIQWWAFLLLFIGFIIKVPSVPVHTWLPDAHVEAPTPISMILAGVLLKMGGYGILRICYPMCPDGGFDLRWVVCAVGALSLVYGAFAALAQKDFKRLVAYSSVSHMGYVVLGLGVWSATQGNSFNPEYWQMGVNGAMFQMVAHGISSAGMFFMVGVIYERVHHRNINEFGGLFAKMPVYSGLAVVIFFAGLGLPGLCGFIGEVLVVLSVWNFSYALAVIAASVVILTAGYILWTLQRVYLGPTYKGPHADELRPMTYREIGIAAPLVVFAFLFGVYPQAVFNYMSPSVNQTVEQLAEWTRDVKAPRLAREAAEKEAAKPVETAARTPAEKSPASIASRGGAAMKVQFVHLPSTAEPLRRQHVPSTAKAP